MTQAEAARVLGVSRPRVHALLKAGRLQSVTIDGRRYVTPESVRARLAGEPIENLKTATMRQRTKHCTQCNVYLTADNGFNHDGKLYSRCRACHVRSTMFDSYRRNANKRGLTFNLTRDYFQQLTHQPCIYCGGMHHKGYNGIDRIDSRIGYEPNNVAGCCKTCNLAKNNQPIDSWLAWLERIKSRPMPQLPGGQE